MENVFVMTAATQWLAALLHQFPVMQQMADLVIKSVVVLALFWIADWCVGRKLNSSCRHLLWLYALSSLLLLPVMPTLLTLWHAIITPGAGSSAPTVLFELSAYAAWPDSAWSIQWGWVALAIYLTPVCILASRLLLAVRGLRRLHRQSRVVTDPGLSEQLNTLKTTVGISRPVALSINPGIESPISWGLLRPQIMLPVQAAEWTESTTSDVLLHELCHIKRLDWLTTLLAWLIACLFWFNPLVWLAVRRLRDESENSCDTAVLNTGRSDTAYAESLLGVATSCIRARRTTNKRTNRSSESDALVQTMLDQNTLKIRISRVLEENKMNASEIRRQVKSSAALWLLLSVATLGVLGSHQVLYAQQQPAPAARVIDEELVPLNAIEPRYPTAAAQAGIEGWAQVRFTVSADGTVAESSVSIVDAQPADIFNNSAIAAATQFRFSPRIVAGEPVDVPNVQYVFRFYMSEASERAAQQQ